MPLLYELLLIKCLHFFDFTDLEARAGFKCEQENLLLKFTDLSNITLFSKERMKVKNRFCILHICKAT